MTRTSSLGPVPDRPPPPYGGDGAAGLPSGDGALGLAPTLPAFVAPPPVAAPAVVAPRRRTAPPELVDTGLFNEADDLNGYLRAINRSLPVGGRYVGFVETYGQTARRLGADRGPLRYAVHVLRDRVLPRLEGARRFYRPAAGRRRALSLTEALGRLVFCGFEIVSYTDEGPHTRIVARKDGAPLDGPAPTCGVLLCIDRVGQGGRLRPFYKLRTMHPYAQYLQAHVYEANDLDTSGKLRDDFRVTGWGRLLRRLWIDELPMLLNWLRGDVKLVGVRPLSEHFYGLYPEDVRALRVGTRPGLFPPFYADMPTTLDEVVDSERRYLLAHRSAPRRTDLLYLWRGLRRILIERARSA